MGVEVCPRGAHLIRRIAVQDMGEATRWLWPPVIHTHKRDWLGGSHVPVYRTWENTDAPRPKAIEPLQSRGAQTNGVSRPSQPALCQLPARVKLR